MNTNNELQIELDKVFKNIERVMNNVLDNNCTGTPNIMDIGIAKQNQVIIKSNIEILNQLGQISNDLKEIKSNIKKVYHDSSG